MKNQYVKTVSSGDEIDDLFMLSEKVVSHKKDGGSYLNIALSDRTGTIRGVVWDNVDAISGAVCSGDFVHVSGVISEYKGQMQVIVRDMTRRLPESVEPGDYIPATSRNVDAMFDRLVKLCDAIRKPHLKNLLNAFWSDADFVRKFKKAPAAKKMHHAYLGGLLEHTLSMAILVDKISGHYNGIDSDMLLAGAVLHDIGKIREFDYQYKIDYSTEGRLITHLVIGCFMLEDKLSRIENFPETDAMLLKHMILSHHGSREFGSPEPPKTIEAVMLNYIDEIDAKVNGIREFMASEAPNDVWTPYHRLLERHFYRGKVDHQNDKPQNPLNIE
jgi:3'-5' exoribonuclease